MQRHLSAALQPTHCSATEQLQHAGACHATEDSIARPAGEISYTPNALDAYLRRPPTRSLSQCATDITRRGFAASASMIVLDGDPTAA
eukprot:53110-Eustigmatos_ZCMA.PRE.1